MAIDNIQQKAPYTYTELDPAEALKRVLAGETMDLNNSLPYSIGTKVEGKFDLSLKWGELSGGSLSKPMSQFKFSCYECEREKAQIVVGQRINIGHDVLKANKVKDLKDLHSKKFSAKVEQSTTGKKFYQFESFLS